MRRPPRIAVLIALLAGAAAWVAIDLRGPAAPTSAKAPATGSSRDTEQSAAASASQARQPEIPSRLTLGKFGADPFSAQSWLPRRKPAAVSAPPDPVTPPLPYRFAGQFHRESGIEVYVARGEEIFPVKEGDTLDGQYKVDSVSSTEVSFIYLPSGTRQTLQFSALKEPELTAQGGPLPPRAPASAPAQAPVAKLIPAPTPGTSLSDNSSPGKTGPAQLRWEGPASARAGANFNVSLRVTSGEQIRAAPMQLRFDPAVLESVSVRPGRYFSGEKTGSFGYRVNSDGSIFVGVSNQTPASASDAEMLVLTFKSIKAAAAAEISVASLNLQGAAGRTIAYGSLTPFKTTIIP